MLSAEVGGWFYRPDMRTRLPLLLLFSVAREAPQAGSSHYGPTSRADDLADGAHCWTCNTVGGAKDADYREWHRRELNMMVYASGCKKCGYHGAYRGMEFPEGHRRAELGPWPRK